MLPYLAQGAGSALEDGAALGVLLSTADSRKDLPKALNLYEQLRKTRSTKLQERSMIQVSKYPARELRAMLTMSVIYRDA